MEQPRVTHKKQQVQCPNFYINYLQNITWKTLFTRGKLAKDVSPMATLVTAVIKYLIMSIFQVTQTMLHFLQHTQMIDG